MVESWFLALAVTSEQNEIHQGFSQVQIQFNAVLISVSASAFEENVHPGLTVIIENNQGNTCIKVVITILFKLWFYECDFFAF